MNVIQSEVLTEVDATSHGFFSRIGGASSGEFSTLNVGLERGDDDNNVLKNREIISKHFGLELSDLIMLKQIHGGKVHVIDSKNVEKYKFNNIKQATSIEGDAIITKEKGILIGVGTADCAPILLCDKDSGYVGAVHAGWRGAVGDVIENTIEKMRSFGCAHIVAAIGPCIQKRHFEVKDDMVGKIDRRYLSIFCDKVFFDMQLLILEKLMKLGVKSVSKLNIDTFGDENYFSYRRQNGTCGVQFSGIMIKK